MMGQKFTRPFTRDDQETECEVEIEVLSWGCAAQTYGPPEKCYPAEPMECEVVQAWIGEEGGQPVILTAEEYDRAEAEFLADPPEPDYPDYDDHD